MRQLDWETETPRIMSARKQGRDVIDYRSPLFSIKAVRSAIVSTNTNNRRKYNPLSPHQQYKMPFGIITTIKSISKSAVERNRVRTRFKEAMRIALSRAPSLPERGDGDGRSGTSKPLQLPIGRSPNGMTIPRLLHDLTHLGVYLGYHFLATLTAGIYAEPLPSLVEQMRKAIGHISAGTESGARTAHYIRKPSAPPNAHKLRARSSDFNS